MVARDAGQSLSFPSLSATARRSGRFKQASTFAYPALSQASRRGGAATAAITPTFDPISGYTFVFVDGTTFYSTPPIAIIPVLNPTTGYYEVTIAGNVYSLFTDTEFPTVYGYNQ